MEEQERLEEFFGQISGTAPSFSIGNGLDEAVPFDRDIRAGAYKAHIMQSYDCTISSVK